MNEPVMAIHGGAGTLSASTLSEELAARYHDALRQAIEAGQRILVAGGDALDAVSAAVQALEDCPLFNAGYGAVFTRDGTHELDAAVMDGASLAAGAVAGVSHVRHPVLAARAVMNGGEHVLLVGPGAEIYARDAGLEMVPSDFFSTRMRREQLDRARAAGRVVLDHDERAEAAPGADAPLDEEHKLGTVGAVALDMRGHLAAATSTGGLTNKRVGRVGDSPLIGAGTYADDRYAAVSCTGSGEMFIRVAAAHDVCARMAYGAASLEAATNAVVHEALPPLGGTGGLIAVDREGHLSLTFNSEGMYRAWVRGKQPPVTAIFR